MTGTSDYNIKESQARCLTKTSYDNYRFMFTFKKLKTANAMITLPKNNSINIPGVVIPPNRCITTTSLSDISEITTTCLLFTS